VRRFCPGARACRRKVLEVKDGAHVIAVWLARYSLQFNVSIVVSARLVFATVRVSI
jgi:hypothetical protein